MSGPGPGDLDHAREHRTPAARPAQQRALLWALGLNGVFLLVEVAGGVVFRSLALLADAAHMVADVAGLGIALAGLAVAARPVSQRHSFGFARAEVLAAQLSALLLLGGGVWIVVEAVERLTSPAPEPVAAGGLMVVAFLGLVVNLLSVVIVHRVEGESLTMRASVAHLATDAVGSVGALLAGAAIWWLGWQWADPAVSLGTAALVVWAAARLLAQATHVLMEGAPTGVDPAQIREAMVAVDGVADVHHLHVWNLASDDAACSAHVALTGQPSLHDAQLTAQAVRVVLEDRFDLTHVTLELEDAHDLPAQESLWGTHDPRPTTDERPTMTQLPQTTPTGPAGPATPPVVSGSRVRDLHPGWFAAAMGTAILAVATYGNPGGIAAVAGAAHALGVALAVLAYAVGLVLVVAYAARWFGHPEAALADLRHPGFGGLHATLPGGLLVVAVMTSVIGPALFPTGVVQALITGLALVGGVLALVVGVAFSYVLFTSEVPAASVNGGWFIPPVVTIIIPMVLAPLIPAAPADIARLLLFVGYACLGLGFLLFLFIMGVLHDRLVLHPLPPAQMAPSLWIALGPVAVAILAPLSLARAGQGVFGTAGPAVTLLSQLFGTALWGFGLWWLAIAATLLTRYLRAGRLPFHVGWWAFTFPLGAFTVATMNLAAAWQLPALDAVGGILYLALAAFWATVTLKTVSGLRTGQIWRR